MRKTIAAATLAASVAVSGVTGAMLGTPALASATETADGAADWVREALSGLVQDGTIDQAQADAVTSALEEARPAHRFAHRWFGGHLDLATVAESLGMTEDDLRTTLEDDQTIAEVAEERGADVQVVVDAIVAAQEERLAEDVAAGGLTQAQADAILAEADERATALVNGERPSFGGRGHRDIGPRWGGPGPGPSATFGPLGPDGTGGDAA